MSQKAPKGTLKGSSTVLGLPSYGLMAVVVLSFLAGVQFQAMKSDTSFQAIRSNRGDDRGTNTLVQKGTPSSVAVLSETSSTGTAAAVHSAGSKRGDASCAEPSRAIQKEAATLTNLIADRWHSSGFSKAGDKTQQYCLWQCEARKCCAGGTRGVEHFKVVADTRHAKLHHDGFRDVTLCTQGTVSRMHSFKLQHAAWAGPKIVVFTVFNHSADFYASAAAELELIRSESAGFSNTLTLIYVATHYRLPASDTDEPEHDGFSRLMEQYKYERGYLMSLYPINTLRNLVVDLARTNWVFPLDMDFIPSVTLYSRLREVYFERFNSMARPALIIPHLEAKKPCEHAPWCSRICCCGKQNTFECKWAEGGPPKTFADALVQFRAEQLVPFRMPIGTLGPEYKDLHPDLLLAVHRKDGSLRGTYTTNYEMWHNDSVTNTLGFSPRILSSLDRQWYEPFLVLRRFEAAVGDPKHHELPRYDESFVGRYRNKISFVNAMSSNKYQFMVINSDFSTHMSHEDPAAENVAVTFSKAEKQVSDYGHAGLKKVMWQIHNAINQENIQKFDSISAPQPGPYDNGWTCNAVVK